MIKRKKKSNYCMTLIHGDCLDVMKKLKPQSIDLILTDPPYGTTACKWDTVIDLKEMWSCLNNISKVNSALVLFSGQPFTSNLIMSNLGMFKYCWTWEKERLTNIAQVKNRPGKTIEDICVFYKKQSKYEPQMTKHKGPLRSNKVKKGVLGKLTDTGTKKVKEYKDTGWRYPTQLLKFQRDILKCNLHPTQKPVALLEYLIKTYTNEGDTVLDFTMGSGSCGVAAKNLNRKFIGIELDETYFKIAKKRIENI